MKLLRILKKLIQKNKNKKIQTKTYKLKKEMFKVKILLKLVLTNKQISNNNNNNNKKNKKNKKMMNNQNKMNQTKINLHKLKWLNQLDA